MRKRLLPIAGFLCVGGVVFAAGPPDSAVWEYVLARARQELIPYTVDVSIRAEIPSLKKVGSLHAVRHQAGLGRFNYESVQFEGDKIIKTNVIARYLSAELEAQRPEEKLATQISPANYEFKLKGREQVNGREVLVFQVKPRKKRQGLFHGQIWIDAETRQPLRESGKVAKLPSVWVKEIIFTREYTTANGVAVPERITSEVKTRIVGKAQISIEFHNYRFDLPGELTAAVGSPADPPLLARPLSDFVVPQLY